jgi:hypothetical protein
MLNIIIISWQNARMSHALPRIELADLCAPLAARLAPRVRRLGYLGEFFRCMAHQPRALAAFMDLTEAAEDGLPKRLAEVVTLTCCARTNNDYERNQHERLCLRLGFGRQWVAAVNALKPEASALLTPDERSVQRLTLIILETDGRAARGLFEEAVQHLGPGPAVAILMLIGRCVSHGFIVNTLALQPPVPSVLEDGFGS